MTTRDWSELNDGKFALVVPEGAERKIEIDDEGTWHVSGQSRALVARTPARQAVMDAQAAALAAEMAKPSLESRIAALEAKVIVVKP